MVRHPGSALLFLLFAPLLWIIIRNMIRGKEVFRSFRGSHSVRSLYDVFLIKWFFSSLFLILFLLFLILSLFGFSGNNIVSERLPSKRDVVFVVDISRSMLARDVEPSRLERAQALMRTLVDHSSDTRYGLVIFNEPGISMVPVTEDLQALISAVDILGPELLSSRGTDIAAGISAAGRAFQDGERRRRFIVLFSDGEHHKGDPRSAAAALNRDREIITHTVGLGSLEGAEVPSADGGVVLDESGKRVISKLNRVVLESAAAAGGGAYIDGGDADALKRLRSLTGIADKDDGSDIRLERSTLYRPFLALALLFLFLHASVRMVPWRER